MDFTLSKTHLLLQELYRKFAEAEVKLLSEETDETEISPKLIDALRKRNDVRGNAYV